MSVSVGLLIALALASSAMGVGGSIAASSLTNKKSIELMREQNSFNSSEALASRLFNADEAQKQRDYETMMSNSAYQRAVSDMEAAGINPILAASNGGAGTPTGSAAYGEAAHSAATPNLSVPDIISATSNSVMKAVMLSNLVNGNGQFSKLYKTNYYR